MLRMIFDSISVERVVYVATAAVALCGAAVLCAQENSEAIAIRMASLNRAAVESVRDVALTYFVVTERPDERFPPTGQYWQVGGDFRIKWSKGAKWFDTIVRGGRMYTLQNVIATDGSRKELSIGSISPFKGFLSQPCMPLTNCLFNFHPGAGLVGLRRYDELLDIPHTVTKAETSDGGRTVTVELDFGAKGCTEFSFYKPANYLINRVRSKSPNGEGSVREVKSFVEAAGGVFFPEVVREDALRGGDVVSTAEYRFSDIRVNGGLSGRMFEWGPASGTLVKDLIGGTEYTIGEEASARPLERLTVPALSSEVEVSGGAGRQTKAEPLPVTRWVLTALALTAVAAGVLLRRWNRSRGVGRRVDEEG